MRQRERPKDSINANKHRGSRSCRSKAPRYTSHTAYISGSRDLRDLTNEPFVRTGREEKPEGRGGGEEERKKRRRGERRRVEGRKDEEASAGGLVIPVGEANGQRPRAPSPLPPQDIFSISRRTCAAFVGRARGGDERKCENLPRRRRCICYNCDRATETEYFSSSTNNDGAGRESEAG